MKTTGVNIGAKVVARHAGSGFDVENMLGRQLALLLEQLIDVAGRATANPSQGRLSAGASDGEVKGLKRR